MSYFAIGFMKAFVGTLENSSLGSGTSNRYDNGILINEAGVQTACLKKSKPPKH